MLQIFLPDCFDQLGHDCLQLFGFIGRQRCRSLYESVKSGLQTDLKRLTRCIESRMDRISASKASISDCVAKTR